MDKLKLKSGREVELKELGLDERDDVIDSSKYTYDDKGKVSGVDITQSFITKCLRFGLNGKADDKYILGLSFEERNEIFKYIHDSIYLGKGKASSSK